jgi:hypothetical protein
MQSTDAQRGCGLVGEEAVLAVPSRMAVLGGGAVSYEQGTPVLRVPLPPENHSARVRGRELQGYLAHKKPPHPTIEP